MAEQAAVPRIMETNSGSTRATWNDYLILTKPRVISLLLLTAWLAQFMAARGWPGLLSFLAVGFGFYGMAGASHTFNMVIDRDIDLRMTRTSTRPIAAGRISVANALIFGFTLAFSSFALLWFGAAPLSAWMSLAGLLFYVFVYTIGLKRYTAQNIVIGGAAGAFPPLVGWAAVSNSLNPLAWLLFALIFLWTPVHFWALAILIKDDYAEAKIPMLPVVAGEKKTSVHIAVYAVLTTLCALAPVVLQEGAGRNAGPAATWLYGLVALLLSVDLLRRSWLLWQLPERKRASGLFHYSMIYLALLFAVLALDRSPLPQRTWNAIIAVTQRVKA